MDQSRKYLDPRDIASIEGLRLRARAIVDGFLAGSHRSTHLGSSIDFAQHREYSPGDDLRRVDWKIFGRTDKFYVKQFDDETNLPCMFALDSSTSMGYQGANSSISKFEYASCLLVSLAWLVLRQDDASGLVLFNEEIESWLESAGDPTQITAIIDMIESCQPKPLSCFDKVLHEMAERLSHRGMVILISDFLGEPDEIEFGLAHLKHQNQEVIAVRVVDPDEEDFPFDDPTMFECLEHDEPLTVDPAIMQQAYFAEYHRFDTCLREMCNRFAFDYVVVRTDTRFDQAISDYLTSRRVAGA